MTTYARIADGAVVATFDLTPEQYAALQANGKAANLRLWIVDPMPTPSASQVVMIGPVVIGPVEAHQTSVLRNKTQAELDADSNAAEQAQIKTMIANLTASIQADRSALTQAQRLALLEQDAVRLSRIARYYLRSLA